MSQSQWVISSPLFIVRNKQGKKWYLNLNNYRNTHYQTLNSMKKKYKEFMTQEIESLPSLEKVSISFHIYARDRRLFDIGNIISVTEKFFLDALVELGKLPDDNYLHVPETHTYFECVHKEEPRVDIIIKEITNGNSSN